MAVPQAMEAFKSARPNFLLLAVVVVFLGVAKALHDNASVSALLVALTIIGAITAHIAVNAFNEYQDFESGLDNVTERTPFSGGSGLLPEHPHLLHTVKRMAFLSLMATAFIGLYLIYQSGWGLLPLGLCGVAIIVSYTRVLNKQPYLCLVSPGLAFGPFMVCGAYYVMQGAYSIDCFIVASIPFFLVNNLLLLNQLPDIEADAAHGRNHWAIRFGYRSAVNAYGVMALAAFCILVFCVFADYLPRLTLIAALPICVSGYIWWRLSREVQFSPKHIPLLGINVAICLSVPALMGGALLV